MVKPAMAGPGVGSTTGAATTSEINNNKLYKGVRKRKWGKWVSEIRLPNSRERIWLGSYDSPEKAARAFDAALYCLRGCHARFNFPDTPFNLEEINVAGNQSLSSQEIQEVAAKFANDVPPPHEITQQPSSESPRESASGGSNSVRESNTTTSISVCECDGTVQVDNNIGDMRSVDYWTFFNMLDDDSNANGVVAGSYDYGFYYGLDKMHSGEFIDNSSYPPFEDQIEGDHDAFSHHSFLWSWNF